MGRIVAVRQADLSDALAIAEVHVASWRGAYAGLLPQAMLDGLSVQHRETQWRNQLQQPAQTTIVALDRGAVVGFASVGASRDGDAAEAGELYAIYVMPDAWGAGAGHALHEAAVSLLGREFDEAVLWVLDGNNRARSFYERHEWVVDGAAKDDERGDVVLHEIRYRRPLAPRTVQ